MAVSTTACASKSQCLSIMSYNMHGFNQGSNYLINVCESNIFDIMFIQEHWLSPAIINKIINISDNYIGLGISAMENAVSAGFLRGRPFGVQQF